MALTKPALGPFTRGEQRPDPEQRRNPWAMFAVLALAQFTVVLDTGIVYIALPSIQREMGFSQTSLAWVMDAYILAFGGLMLLGGRAADLFGRRRVLFAGLSWFGLASLACGLSTEPWQIVAARAAQGLGAALVSPAVLAMVIDTFRQGPDRYKALSILGGVGGVAGAMGTLLGGLLTAVAWQWAFLINVPVAVALLAVGYRMLPASRSLDIGGVDVIGALSGTGALCLLLYAVLRGSAQGWGSGTTVVQFAVAAALMTAFLTRQLRAKAPLIPRPLFRLRNVVLGNAANTIAGALLFGVFFLLTLYLQLSRGYSPLNAALRIMPISVSVFVGSQVTIRLMARIGPGEALAGGLLAQAAGLFWLSVVLDPVRNVATTFVLPGMLWGFGSGISIVAAFVVCTSGVHGRIMGAASGLVSTTLQMGGALGVALASIIAERHAASSGADFSRVMADGQSAALAASAVLALVGIPLMVWLRRSWKPSAHHEAAPAEAAVAR